MTRAPETGAAAGHARIAASIVSLKVNVSTGSEGPFRPWSIMRVVFRSPPHPVRILARQSELDAVVGRSKRRGDKSRWGNSVSSTFGRTVGVTRIPNVTSWTIARWNRGRGDALGPYAAL